MQHATFLCVHRHSHVTPMEMYACEDRARHNPIVFAVREAIAHERDDYCMFLPEFPEPDPNDRNLDMLRLHNAAYTDNQPVHDADNRLMFWHRPGTKYDPRRHDHVMMFASTNVDAISYWRDWT